jgi:lysozyme
MELSKRGAAFVGKHEGWRERYYLDPVGIPTIGYGFTWRSAAFRRWWAENRPGKTFNSSASITRHEGNEILVKLFDEEYGAAVNKFLGKAVPQHVFDAMASVTYNCGAGCLRWKWAAAAKGGDYKKAAAILSTTAVTAKRNGVRVRLPGLVRRRSEEASLLANGAYRDVTIVAEKSDFMSKGSKGNAVLSVQTQLRVLGFYLGELDGDFGAGTEASVMAFQSAMNLSVDGIVGPATTKMLNDASRQALKKQEVIKDVAADNRVSTTEMVAIGTGVASGANAAKEVVDAVNDVGSSLVSAGPWILVSILIIGFSIYIWKQRRGKREAAKSAMEIL